jgi:hypothetical protein
VHRLVLDRSVSDDDRHATAVGPTEANHTSPGRVGVAAVSGAGDVADGVALRGGGVDGAGGPVQAGAGAGAGAGDEDGPGGGEVAVAGGVADDSGAVAVAEDGVA